MRHGVATKLPLMIKNALRVTISWYSVPITGIDISVACSVTHRKSTNIYEHTCIEKLFSVKKYKSLKIKQ